MLAVCYPKCTTCKKALAWLDAHGFEYDYRDIKTENPTYEELKDWYKKSGLPIRRFFNTSGNSYKDLGLKDKLAEMSDVEKLQMLAMDGMLVKRPIIVDGETVLVGFKEAEWERLPREA
ncbi:MAG: arsenate reductase family protein [Clostridiales Family XIII bacterium]|jgi:arsenate reductase|nr:arsenate reductase family protein [Clostridiales Family XIII bacterium]